MQKSFTLIELLVVIGIIIVLSAIILPNYRVGERQFALQRSAQKLAQDIRRAQEMSMSMKKYNCSSGSLKGYGILLWPRADDPTIYSLSAFCDGSPEVLERLQFEKNVKIHELAVYKDGAWENKSLLWIYFVPPDPVTVMMADAEQIRITLSLETDPSQTRIIKVNKAGLIYVE